MNEKKELSQKVNKAESDSANSGTQGNTYKQDGNIGLGHMSGGNITGNVAGTYIENIEKCQIINLKEQGKQNLYTNSFCGCLAWIQRISQGAGLEKLDRYHKSELLKAINNAHEVGNSGFTKFELEVLVLVVSYCCYFTHNWSSPFQKFEKFNKSERYYSEMRKLVSSKEEIRYTDVRLSSLIKDTYISELVKKIEQYDG